jgi:hypothetical protein
MKTSVCSLVLIAMSFALAGAASPRLEEIIDGAGLRSEAEGTLPALLTPGVGAGSGTKVATESGGAPHAPLTPGGGFCARWRVRTR